MLYFFYLPSGCALTVYRTQAGKCGAKERVVWSPIHSSSPPGLKRTQRRGAKGPVLSSALGRSWPLGLGAHPKTCPKRARADVSTLPQRAAGTARARWNCAATEPVLWSLHCSILIPRQPITAHLFCSALSGSTDSQSQHSSAAPSRSKSKADHRGLRVTVQVARITGWVGYSHRSTSKSAIKIWLTRVTVHQHSRHAARSRTSLL